MESYLTFNMQKFLPFLFKKMNSLKFSNKSNKCSLFQEENAFFLNSFDCNTFQRIYTIMNYSFASQTNSISLSQVH